MKKYIYILIAVITLSSCDKQLELTSISELTVAGFWDSEEKAKTAHTGLYTSLRSSHVFNFYLGELRSDIWGGPTFESPSSVAFQQSNITEATAPFGGWGGYYKHINGVNDFLVNLPNVDFNDEAEKNHLLGQAYGLRAFYYYTLLKTWGDVPIILEPLTTVELETLPRARSSQAEVMALIKSDIAASLAAFGADNSFYGGTKVYWSKPASLALKGDVYIWSGNLLDGGSADFTEAKSALEQVSGVSLESSISNLWGASKEGNSEFIVSMQFQNDVKESFFGGSMTGRTTEISPTYSDSGASMSTFVTAGGNRFGQSIKTIELLDDNDDSRKNATFIRLYTDNNGGAGYLTFTPAKYAASILNKFLGVVRGTKRVSENDIPIYRYADVLLLLAEAKNLLGQDPSVEINRIRERAYGANYVSATHGYSNGSKTDNANAILDERYKEFIAEGKRWYDLRRAGNSFVYDNVQYIDASKSHLLLLPIRTSDIGANDLLVQTPGY